MHKQYFRRLKENSALREVNLTLRFFFYFFTHSHQILKFSKHMNLSRMSDVIDLWRFWRMFPFHYFRMELYLKDWSRERFRSIIPEFYFDNILIPKLNSFDLREKLSDKIWASRFLHSNGLPVPTLLCFSIEGRFFDSSMNILTDLEVSNLLMSDNNKIFIKPQFGKGGRGINVVNAGKDSLVYNGDIIEISQLLMILKSDNYLLEVGINQVNETAVFNKDSANTLRIITYNKSEQEIAVIAAILRMGRKGSSVDNSAKGGVSCSIDLDSWCLSSMGISEHPIGAYFCHPDSGVVFDSHDIPYKNDVINIVKRGASLLMDCKLIGWDIVLAKNGPLIIEVNPGFGIDHLQLSTGVGLLTKLD